MSELGEETVAQWLRSQLEPLSANKPYLFSTMAQVQEPDGKLWFARYHNNQPEKYRQVSTPVPMSVEQFAKIAKDLMARGGQLDVAESFYTAHGAYIVIWFPLDTTCERGLFYGDAMDRYAKEMCTHFPMLKPL